MLEQLALAVKLNTTTAGREILRLYAEIAYYGHGYYGLEAASCGYFGRSPAQLTLVQAAMLAGVVNAPTYDDPIAYPAAARARLVHVIGRMAAVGYLTRRSKAPRSRRPSSFPPSAAASNRRPRLERADGQASEVSGCSWSAVGGSPGAMMNTHRR